MTDRSPRSRLDAAVDALDRAVSWAGVAVGTDGRPGWTRCNELIDDPGRLSRWQRDTAAAYGERADATLTAAGLVLDWYLAAVALPAVGGYHLQRVVPDLDPAAMALRAGPPGSPVAGTALLDPEPAVVDAGPDALGGRLRAHAERFLATYAPLTRFGRRTLWAAVTDAVDTAFLTAGWVSGERERAAADAAAVLGTGDGGWVSGAGGSTLYTLHDRAGRTHWSRRRHGCCLLYRLPDVQACLTCPRVSDAERAASAPGWD